MDETEGRATSTREAGEPTPFGGRLDQHDATGSKVGGNAADQLADRSSTGDQHCPQGGRGRFDPADSTRPISSRSARSVEDARPAPSACNSIVACPGHSDRTIRRLPR